MDLEPVLIGRGDELYNAEPLYIVPEARRRHLAIFGGTGAGKSTLLRGMIASDIAAGLGCTVTDPHGQLVEDTLDNHIPRHRSNDIIYFNPKDPERCLGLNLLDCPRPEQRPLVVSNVISIFKRLWPDAFASGARMEDIFRNSLYALIEQPEPVSILALPKLLTVAAYRADLLAAVRNPAVLDFFHGTFDQWTKSFREEAISSVLNKVRAFLTNPLLRAVIGQAKSGFNFRWAMDNRKIILCDLSGIGEDEQRLLGSLIIMQERLAALSRGDIPEEERVPHFCYVEEAHHFIGDFSAALTGTRKFAFYLVTATQGVDQLSKETVSAIFNNAGSLISFRVSSADASRLKKEFGMVFPGAMVQELHELRDFKAYVRTLVCDERGCEPSQPARMATYPPSAKERGAGWRENIIRTSNERFTRSRAEVDAAIARFMVPPSNAKQTVSAGSENSENPFAARRSPLKKRRAAERME